MAGSPHLTSTGNSTAAVSVSPTGAAAYPCIAILMWLGCHSAGGGCRGRWAHCPDALSSRSASLCTGLCTEPEPSKAQGIESRLEQLLEVTEGMAKRNEYRFNRMEMQLEKMERLYAQVPPRGKKKEDDKVRCLVWKHFPIPCKATSTAAEALPVLGGGVCLGWAGPLRRRHGPCPGWRLMDFMTGK